jgi:hypothetical protein
MQCPECGYGYAERSASDRKRHRKYHDEKLNGLPAPFIDDEHIIWRAEPPPMFPDEDQGEDIVDVSILADYDWMDDEIIVLTPSSPLQLRKLASKVSTLGNTETQFTGGVYHHTEKPAPKRDRHVFLYEHNARFIGIVVLDLRRQTTPFSWEEYDKKTPRSWAATSPFWSVSFLWTLQKYRRSRIATRLCTFAAHYLGKSVDQLGVSPPLNDSSEPFARSLWPDGLRFGA